MDEPPNARATIPMKRLNLLSRIPNPILARFNPISIKPVPKAM